MWCFKNNIYLPTLGSFSISSKLYQCPRCKKKIKKIKLLKMHHIQSISCRLTVLVITAVDQIPLLVTTETCQYEFLQLIVGFLVVWSLSILVQCGLIIVSLRGTILEDELRWHSEYLLYIKLGKWYLYWSIQSTYVIHFPPMHIIILF